MIRLVWSLAHVMRRAVLSRPQTLSTSARPIHCFRSALSPSVTAATPLPSAKAAVSTNTSAVRGNVSSIPPPPIPPSSSPPPASSPDDVWSSLYLPVKPPSSSHSPFLPFQPTKPATPSSLASTPPLSRSSPATLPPPAPYTSRPLPRLPLLLLLLLSVPGMLLARDDWRAQLMARYPDFPWPHWMRVEATRLDRLSLEERRRRAEHGWVADNDDDSTRAVGRVEDDHRGGEANTGESGLQQQQMEAALHSLQAVQDDNERWVRERETSEQRAERAAKEVQRQSLLSSIASLEVAVRDEMRRQQDEVGQQLRSAESRRRSEFVDRLDEQAADITHSLALRLNQQRQSIAADERRSLRAAEASATQQAREEEVSRGVQRITERLQQQEQAAEAFVRHRMAEEERRLLDEYQTEADSKEAALQWAAKEERRFVSELEDVKQLHYVSANLHRLRLLLSSVDELLHHSPSSSPELWLGVWTVLRSVGADDPVIATAVSSITDDTLEAGVQPFDQLQTAFKQHIERPLRAATLTAPPATPPPSLSAHLLSRLLSPLLLHQHSLVASSDDSSRLSRACYYLYRSAERDIARCVAEIGGMQGVEAREAVSDWLRHAADRAAVEQAASVISTRLSTLELSLIDGRRAHSDLTRMT